MCPRCKSDEVSRSRQRRFFVDFFMQLWGMKPYRCRECQTRFYLPSHLEAKIAAERAWLQDVEDNEQGARPSDRSRQ